MFYTTAHEQNQEHRVRLGLHTGSRNKQPLPSKLLIQIESHIKMHSTQIIEHRNTAKQVSEK